MLLALPPLEIPRNLCRTAQARRATEPVNPLMPGDAQVTNHLKKGEKKTQTQQKTNSKAYLEFPVRAGEQPHDTKRSNMHSSIIPCGNVQIALAWQPSSRTSCPYTESYTCVFLFALLSPPQLYFIIRNHSRRRCTQGADIKMVIFRSVSFHSRRFLHQLLVRKSFSCLSEGYNPLPFPGDG